MQKLKECEDVFLFNDYYDYEKKRLVALIKVLAPFSYDMCQFFKFLFFSELHKTSHTIDVKSSVLTLAQTEV